MQVFLVQFFHYVLEQPLLKISMPYVEIVDFIRFNSFVTGSFIIEELDRFLGMVIQPRSP